MKQLETKMIERLCELLNEQININGKIQRSNKTIWAVLHDMDNTIWQHCLNGADDFTPHNHRNRHSIDRRLLELNTAIKRYKDQYPNVITPFPAEYKRQKRDKDQLFQNSAWHLLMMLREVYCDVYGIDLPNSDSSIGALDENHIQI